VGVTQIPEHARIWIDVIIGQQNPSPALPPSTVGPIGLRRYPERRGAASEKSRRSRSARGIPALFGLLAFFTLAEEDGRSLPYGKAAAMIVQKSPRGLGDGAEQFCFARRAGSRGLRPSEIRRACPPPGAN